MQLFLVASLGLVQAVSISEPGILVSQFAQRLSLKTGVKHRVSRALAGEVLVVECRDWAEEQVRKEVAEVLQGKWVKIGEVWELQLDQEIVGEESQQWRNERQEKLAKLKEEGLGDGLKFGVVEKLWSQVPETWFFDLQPGEVKVVSTQGLVGFPRLDLGKVQSELQELERTGALGGGNGDGTGGNRLSDLEALDLEVWRAYPTKKAADWDVRMTLVARTKDGGAVEISSTRLDFGVARKFDGAELLRQRKANWSLESKQYWRALDSGVELDAETQRKFLTPAENEPIKLLLGEMLVGMAKEAGESLVACVPDEIVNGENLSRRLILADVLSEIVGGGWARVDKKDWGIQIAPQWPSFTRSARLNRPYSEQSFAVLEKKWFLSLDEQAQMAIEDPALGISNLAAAMDQAVNPGRFSAISRFGDDWEYLVWWGGLTAVEKASIVSGQTVGKLGAVPNLRSAYKSFVGISPGRNALGALGSDRVQINFSSESYPIAYAVTQARQRVRKSTGLTAGEVRSIRNYVGGQDAARDANLLPYLLDYRYLEGKMFRYSIDFVLPNGQKVNWSPVEYEVDPAGRLTDIRNFSDGFEKAIGGG